MKDDFRSYFSPNLMSKETLEMLFVQRQELAKEVTESIVDSISTSSKHYILLIGPRGIGKTHFTSLIYHRLKNIAAFQEKAVIAWLREEEWGVSSFLDLLIRLLRATLSEGASPTIAEQINKLYEIPIKNAEALAKNLLEELVGNRTLVILMENLNQIFKGLGDKEQRKLRAYLQNNPFCTILATSQSLFDGVSLRDSPFYGFFQIKYLNPLNLEEATELLKNIANHKKDNELARLISSPMGTARIRAIHHLTGGNHRVYIIFSEFLNAKALDDLVEPFMRTLDDLTPYYQSRLNEISAQQQKIIEYLCEERRAVVVKEIAQHCFMTHQTASSHLKTLKEKGYVISHNIGRESYYELQEPLMRLCIEVKMHHDKPIRLFVDFLRFWYSSNDLETRLAATSEDSFERGYLKQAIELTKKEPNPVISICREEYNEYIREENWNKALEIVEEILAILEQEKESEKNKKDAIKYLISKGIILLNLRQHEEALETFEEATKIDSSNTLAWFYLGVELGVLMQYEKALLAFEKVIEIDPKHAFVWLNKGVMLFDLGQFKKALDSINNGIALASDNKGFLSVSLFEKGKCLLALNQWDEAYIALNEGFLQADSLQKPYIIDITNIIAILFSSTKDANTWQDRIKKLVEIFDRHNALSFLDKGLLANIDLLISSTTTLKLVQTWVDLWKGAVGKEKLPVAFRFMDIAIKYYENDKDPRVLLELPIEEREILQEVLKSNT
ncbi:MAG: tetratricopeptide repeat protein [Acidobacteria bacterium]|nr:tetratricopeptide repeat protein [Acidobacteriota bacterium]